MWKRGISLGLILAFSQIASVAVARAEDAPTLLASVKAATGGDAWNNIRSLRIRGKEIAGGMTRSREEWDDVHPGRTSCTPNRSSAHKGLGSTAYRHGYRSMAG